MIRDWRFACHARWPAALGACALVAALGLAAHDARGSSPGAPDGPGDVYPWPHAASDDSLEERFAAPEGFARVAVPRRSFGEFVRWLPLRPEGTPVVDFRGRVIRDAGDEHIAAVVDIDVGGADLEQCADFVIRLDAEWRYGRGERAIQYGTASGERMAYSAFLSHARPGHVADTHDAFRRYLDAVFARANTASLAREGRPVPLAEVQPGDVLVVSGAPYGHAVLVLDVATSPDSRRALLLGEGYMPAQSFHVLRPRRDTPWFVLEPGASEVATPFWRPFPASALRRLS